MYLRGETEAQSDDMPRAAQQPVGDSLPTPRPLGDLGLGGQRRPAWGAGKDTGSASGQSQAADGVPEPPRQGGGEPASYSCEGAPESPHHLRHMAAGRTVLCRDRGGQGRLLAEETLKEAWEAGVA